MNTCLGDPESKTHILDTLKHLSSQPTMPTLSKVQGIQGQPEAMGHPYPLGLCRQKASSLHVGLIFVFRPPKRGHVLPHFLDVTLLERTILVDVTDSCDSSHQLPKAQGSRKQPGQESRGSAKFEAPPVTAVQSKRLQEAITT